MNHEHSPKHNKLQYQIANDGKPIYHKQHKPNHINNKKES